MLYCLIATHLKYSFVAIENPQEDVSGVRGTDVHIVLSGPSLILRKKIINSQTCITGTIDTRDLLQLYIYPLLSTICCFKTLNNYVGEICDELFWYIQGI